MLRARLRHWWQQEIRSLLILALVIFSIRSSLADWSDVPTGSMKPTILEGDRVYVNKLAYDLRGPWHAVSHGASSEILTAAMAA
jgi:signal peptidase I